MLEESVIRQKWNEIVRAHPPSGRAVDSGSFAIALVRWVESGPTPREADDLPACLCPADGVSFYCPIHGAVATGRGLR